MIGDSFPEIVDFVRLPSGSDVVKNFSCQSAALFVFDKRLNGISPTAKSLVWMSAPQPKYRTFPVIIQGSLSLHGASRVKAYALQAD